MNRSIKLAELRSSADTRTLIGYDFRSLFGDLAKRREADVAIVSTEDGFSPLGASARFFEEDLGISYGEVIRPLANWNRFENPRVTLVAIQSKNPAGRLRGVILAPGSNTKSYNSFKTSSNHIEVPNRAFYYNVSYEAIAYACIHWSSRNIGISHLCSSGDFHEDIATCQAEALAHFCDAKPPVAPKSFIFCGCCIEPDQLNGIRRLNVEGNITRHREIQVETEVTSNAVLLNLDWS
jgi:hypothetical protein